MIIDIILSKERVEEILQRSPLPRAFLEELVDKYFLEVTVSREIIKVQVPIASSEPIPEVGMGEMTHFNCLIYPSNRDPKKTRRQPIPVKAYNALKGDLKGYFNGHFSSIVGWAVNDRVADQDW
jgi:hypothetical protein